jgi:drug/metabolite transporter (DMT)-like permease
MNTIGICAALGLATFASAKDLVSKRLSSSLSGTLSAFASFVFALPYYLLLIPLLWLVGIEDFSIKVGFTTFIILRALSDSFAEWFKMESLSRSDISLVSAFQALSPAFLALFSPLLTGDNLSWMGILGLVIISISGVGLVNPFEKISRRQLAGVGFGIASAFFFSINHCLDRLAAQTASAPLSAFAMTLIAAVIIFPFAKINRPKLGALKLEAGRLTLRGLFEVVSMILKLLALQYLPAPTVVAIARLAIPFSILAGAKLFHERDLLRRIIYGSLMTIGSIITILF